MMSNCTSRRCRQWHFAIVEETAICFLLAERCRRRGVGEANSVWHAIDGGGTSMSVTIGIGSAVPIYIISSISEYRQQNGRIGRSLISIQQY